MRAEDVEKIEKAMEKYNIPVYVVVSLISFYGMSIEREDERLINGTGGKEPIGIVPEAPHDNA